MSKCIYHFGWRTRDVSFIIILLTTFPLPFTKTPLASSCNITATEINKSQSPLQWDRWQLNIFMGPVLILLGPIWLVCVNLWNSAKPISFLSLGIHGKKKNQVQWQSSSVSLGTDISVFLTGIQSLLGHRQR